MRMSDLIVKKRQGAALSDEEIDFIIRGYTDGSIPDYQMSALLMAICFRGMDSRETLALTTAMVQSGDTLDLSRLRGAAADKHSTGGVGDKTSLILCPMVAAQGIPMAKMSGRGLGHTGGTIDKLESIPGFSASLSTEQFFETVGRVGFAIAGQTANLVPADKKLYALRDVTGTVDSLPLIASSIMSKKLAAGADIIVLDVKAGSGAFMQTDEEAVALAQEMVAVGRGAGRRTVAVVTDMDEPLGYAVGNALEVMEAVTVLRGGHVPRLTELCLALGAQILLAAGKAADEAVAKSLLQKSLDDGRAFEKLVEMVEAQGGDSRALRDTKLLPKAPVVRALSATATGYIGAIDAEGVGRVCMQLGGGRATKESAIDLAVGVVLHKKVGDYVNFGESMAAIHARQEDTADAAAAELMACYSLTDAPPLRRDFIRGVVQ